MADPFTLEADIRRFLVAKANRLADEAAYKATEHFDAARKLGGAQEDKAKRLGGWQLKLVRQYREFAKLLRDESPNFMPDEKRSAVMILRRAT